MWRTTVSKRMGWESQAELNLLIRNQQEKESPAAGGKPRQSVRKEENYQQYLLRFVYLYASS